MGTWFSRNKDVVQAVKDAVNIGYRRLYTALAYRNESGVREGCSICGVKRDELYVTTKLAAEVRAYRKAFSSIDKALKAMSSLISI